MNVYEIEYAKTEGFLNGVKIDSRFPIKAKDYIAAESYLDAVKNIPCSLSELDIISISKLNGQLVNKI